MASRSEMNGAIVCDVASSGPLRSHHLLLLAFELVLQLAHLGSNLADEVLELLQAPAHAPLLPRNRELSRSLLLAVSRFGSPTSLTLIAVGVGSSSR